MDSLQTLYLRINNKDANGTGRNLASTLGDAASFAQDVADSGAGAPTPSAILAGGKVVGAAIDYKNNHKAGNIFNKDYENATEEQRKVASEIYDQAFIKSGLVPKIGRGGAFEPVDKVYVVNSANIGSAIIQSLNLVDESRINDAAPALTDALAKHLKESASDENYLKTALLRKEGGINHIPFKTGEIEKTADILGAVVEGKFQDNVGLGSGKKKAQYTDLEDTPRQTRDTAGQVTNIEVFHDAMKKSRNKNTGSAIVGVGDMAVAGLAAGLTHGGGSPFLLYTAGKTAISAKEAKECDKAVQILSNSINNSELTNKKLEAADFVAEKAFQDSGLVPKGQHWHSCVKNTNIAKTYDALLTTFINHVPESKIEIAKADMTEALTEHLRFEKSHKNKLRKIAEKGGKDNNIPFKKGAMNKMAGVLQQSVGEYAVGLDSGEKAPLSRPQERKQHIEDGTLKTHLPDQVAKDVKEKAKEIVEGVKNKVTPVPSLSKFDADKDSKTPGETRAVKSNKTSDKEVPRR